MFTILLQTLQTLILFSVFTVLWRLLSQIMKSPLRDLSGPPWSSFISGNLKELYGPNVIWHRTMTRTYGRVFKIHGMFGGEQVYVTDICALQHIIIKDQYAYEVTPAFAEGSKLLFGAGLLSATGDHHKKQRKMLNPVFSVAHMHNLVPIFCNITHQVKNALSKKVSDGPQEINMLHWLSVTSLESIGQAGLGYSFENFETETPTSEYARAITDLSPAFAGISIIQQCIPYAIRLGPAWFRESCLKLIPSSNLQKVKRIVDIMHNTSVEIFTAKKMALSEGDEAVMKQVGEGKDIMSVLLRANTVADEADRLPDSEILAQMNMLIRAAQATTTNALARVLHLLALNPEVQTKLRHDVTEARAGGDLTYDTLMELAYLDAVVRESLRLYAPVTVVTRITQKDTILPLGTPVKSADGKRDIHELHLKKNTTVNIGVDSVNQDPAIWGDDADVWRPERWIDRSIDDIAKERIPGVYSGMMTFFGGPRGCIGFKFAELEMKIVLSMLLESFIFELSDKDIVWQYGRITIPTTKGREKETPHLPLKVSLVKDVSRM